jgi:DNA alkylation repair enzyme
MPKEVSAEAFVEELIALASVGERLRMSQVFGLAKQFVAMEPDEIEKLLDDPTHEVKVGAVSIMGQQATRKGTSDARKKELFELYLRRTDRIDTWDLVDVTRWSRR